MSTNTKKEPIKSLQPATADEIARVTSIREQKNKQVIKETPSALPEAFQGFRSNGSGLGNR